MSDGPKRRGRPPAVVPGSPVCTWLPMDEHDDLIRLAIRRDKSVSELVREAVRISLLEKSPPQGSAAE